MGLFDLIFKKAPKPRGDYKGAFRMLTGYAPHFTSWGGNIYEQELVRESINAVATHASKLEVVVQGTAKPALRNKLKHGPNQWQTWSQFLYRLTTILLVKNNAIIVPVYDEFGEMSGIFPVIPENIELADYNGVPYLRFKFRGERAAIELENVGIMTRFQYRDDFFGDDNGALRQTMELLHIQNQGIQEGVKSAASYRFWAVLNNFADPEDLAEERKRFSKLNFSEEADGGGMLLFPNTYTNIHQAEVKPWVIDAEEMRIIKDGVYGYFGVNEDVIQNKAYGDAWAAFYEGAIEPFAVQFSDVLTKMLFTFREQTNGNRVTATANRIQYMSNADKLQVTQTFADRGMATLNELRAIWNLAPLPDEVGEVIPVRGEYYDLTTGARIGAQEGATDE